MRLHRRKHQCLQMTLEWTLKANNRVIRNCFKMFKIISERPRAKFYLNSVWSSPMTSRPLVFLAKKNQQKRWLFGISMLSLTDFNFQECKSAFRWVRQNHRRTVITATITRGQRNVEEFTLRRKSGIHVQSAIYCFLCNFSFHLSRHMLSWAIQNPRAAVELFGLGSMGREGKKMFSKLISVVKFFWRRILAAAASKKRNHRLKFS